MKPLKYPIYVTKPFLPSIKEFTNGLSEIWESHWLTNRGPILKRFEETLVNYLKYDNICLFTNGTLALQIGMQGFGISGEVITTPFTFVATTHALYWNNIRPVFCDIEPEYFTIDPNKIEALITPRTTAILAVNVFGHPCQHERLQAIAKKNNLKLVYDSAHAFGVTINDKTIALYGDMNMFSFHATKPFHSIEGGMLVYQDPGYTEIFQYLKNFGFKNETEVVMPGTNAKMNELQALMGLEVLKNYGNILQKKKLIKDAYKNHLSNTPGIKFCPEFEPSIKSNYAYVPILIDEDKYGLSRNMLYEKLKEFNIFTRRYFYPLITEYACYQDIPVNCDLTVSKTVSSTILTLPTYYDLEIDDVLRICEIINFIHRSIDRKTN